jgi:hypothetical protein
MTRAILPFYLVFVFGQRTTPSAEPIAQPPAIHIQQPTTQLRDENKTDEEKLYASAHPYMDVALPELKRLVPELAGLKPASSEEQPSDLLPRVGARADELLRKVPDLISEEAVSLAQYAVSQGMFCTGADCATGREGSRSERNFNFLILTHVPHDILRDALSPHLSRPSSSPFC